VVVYTMRCLEALGEKGLIGFLANRLGMGYMGLLCNLETASDDDGPCTD
jgi:hypothetical protein